MSGIIAFAIFASYSRVNPEKLSYKLLKKLGISAITTCLTWMGNPSNHGTSMLPVTANGFVKKNDFAE